MQPNSDAAQDSQAGTTQGLRRLPLWAAAAAAVGGTLWCVKSLAIIATGDQPEYIFVLATVFFAVATIGLVRVREGILGRESGRVRAVAILATLACAIAAAGEIVLGDMGPLGVGLMLGVLAVIGLLLFAGRAIWKNRAMGQWSVLPWLLGWLMIAAVPAGGIFALLHERLFELPILIVGLVWIALGTAFAQQRHRTATS